MPLRNCQVKYIECLAQPIAFSAAINLDIFEFGYRLFQYWNDSENRNDGKIVSVLVIQVQILDLAFSHWDNDQ